MIRIRNLCFSYPGASTNTLDRVSTDIRPGERVAVIGPNASGKTTLARCLNGLLKPGSGSVSVDDLGTRNLNSLPSLRRRVAMVFPEPRRPSWSPTLWKRRSLSGWRTSGFRPL